MVMYYKGAGDDNDNDIDNKIDKNKKKSIFDYIKYILIGFVIIIILIISWRLYKKKITVSDIFERFMKAISDSILCFFNGFYYGVKPLIVSE